MSDKMNQYFWVAVGCLVCSLSINAFLVPHHLLSGGVSGIAIILYFLFGLPIGVLTFAMNIPLLYAAYRLLGKNYTIGTIYGAILFSVAVDATSFVSGFNLIDDPLISAITGGVISGIGSGLIFRVNGSAGGLDIIAGIIKKYYSLNVGFVGFAVNCVIMLISATLFGLKLAMLTLISMFIGANLTDKVVEGFNRKKTVFIVSYNTDNIVEAILKEVGRGVTILHGQGAFTRQNKQVLFVVVSLTQIAKIKMLVHAADPNAFMIVQDAAEVMGRGFTLPGTKQV
ncbi:hypothetical protein SCACP_07440 [Sporomusa carbonis]|uniref:YitT family protein n=1 Tax=Sporomusa carbonis TaxID=3076075 RepID=UPI003A7697CC